MNESLHPSLNRLYLNRLSSGEAVALSKVIVGAINQILHGQAGRG